jgi:hypothetical protein
MAFKFPIHVPLNSTTVMVVALIVGVIFVVTRPKQYSPIDVKIGDDGLPGNPTGRQGIDYRQQAQDQSPYTETGANTIAGPNSWV